MDYPVCLAHLTPVQIQLIEALELGLDSSLNLLDASCLRDVVAEELIQVTTTVDLLEIALEVHGVNQHFIAFRSEFLLQLPDLELVADLLFRGVVDLILLQNDLRLPSRLHCRAHPP